MENFSLADFNANLKLRPKIHCLAAPQSRNKQKRAKTKNNEKNDDSLVYSGKSVQYKC